MEKRYLIFTGYQWRPMKPDELEIMCPENIVSEKSDDAQAGHIFEETEG